MKNKHYKTLCPNCKEYLLSERKKGKQTFKPIYKYCMYCGINLENKKLIRLEDL